MTDVPILLADVGDIIKLIIFFIIIVGPLIGKLVGAAKPDPKRPGQAPAPPQAGVRPNARQQLEAEVNQYLQEARMQPKPAPGNAPFRPPAGEPITAELIMEDPHRGASLAEHVRDHIDTSDLDQHATHLGQDLEQTDEEMDQHLHQVFDHRLGQIAKEQPVATPARKEKTTDPDTRKRLSGSSAEAGPTHSQPNCSAAEISEMLRNPDRFKQAIILSEILARREF